LLRWQVKWSAKGIEALAEWERFYRSNLPAPLFTYVASSKIYHLISSPLHDALAEMAEDAAACELEEVVEEEEDDNAQLLKVMKARAKGKC
jgi:TRAP-type C4-dicarboxylate transport system substrate-binding protein